MRVRAGRIQPTISSDVIISLVSDLHAFTLPLTAPYPREHVVRSRQDMYLIAKGLAQRDTDKSGPA